MAGRGRSRRRQSLPIGEGLPQASGDLAITRVCRFLLPPHPLRTLGPAGQLWTIRAKALGPGMGMEQVGG